MRRIEKGGIDPEGFVIQWILRAIGWSKLSLVATGVEEVVFPLRSERIQRFARYLEITEFEIYRDLIDPIVRVSQDGTLGWLIAQVEIVGTQAGDNGERVKIDSVWAWIELYEKSDGRWYRVGDVSNLRPRE